MVSQDGATDAPQETETMNNAAITPAAATDSRLFTWDEINALLVRIDSRGAGRFVCHRYAPIADTPMGVDMSLAFWDTWGEVAERVR